MLARSVPVAPVRALLLGEFELDGVVVAGVVVDGAVVCEPSGVVWLGEVVVEVPVVDRVPVEGLVVDGLVVEGLDDVPVPVPVDPVLCARARLELSTIAAPVKSCMRMWLAP